MNQQEALAIMESGKSVLLTGAAGSGKTYILNRFIARARKRGRSVAVTATTGLAATHLNGTTIHSWSGIGVHSDFEPHMAAKIGKSRQDLIRKADILVIDEISMLHDFRLDMVDSVLRLVRDHPDPFGGMQVVLCGDFFQLPPVNRSGERTGSFITNSRVWLQNVFTVCYLQTQFRQIDDRIFAEILNGIRAGVLARSQLKLLQDRADATYDPFLPQTRLLTMNVDVDTVNEQRLEELPGDVHEFEMETHGAKQYVEQLQRSCLAPQLLRLKVGATVMCIKNAQDRKFVNGSMGKVVAFEGNTGCPVVELVNGREVIMRMETWELMDGEKKRASIVQFPLRLAWAITVHKSQGMTLDSARIDLSRAFVEGMGYVALSRVRGLKHMVLDGLNTMALRVSPLARELDVELQARSEQARTEHAEHLRKWLEAEGKGENEIPVVKDDILPPDPELFEALRAWRLSLAAEHKVPPYLIAHDKSLQAIAALKPLNDKQLLDVPGFGEAKVGKYGKAIYEIVAKHIA